MPTRPTDEGLAGPTPCADPARLEVIARTLLDSEALKGFRGLALLGCYPCSEHGAHCAFGAASQPNLSVVELLTLVQGLIELAERLQTSLDGGRGASKL